MLATLENWLAHPMAEITLRGLGALFGTLLVWWLAKRVKQVLLWLSTRLERSIERRTQGLGLRGIEVLSREAITTFIQTVTGLVRIILLAILFYAWLLFVAYILDGSHHYAWLVLDPLRESARSALTAVTKFLPNLVILVLVIAVGRILQAIIRAFTTGIALGRINVLGLDSSVATPTHRILSFFLWVAMVILAAPYLPGSGSKAFQAVSVMLGVLVSLGSSSLISNLLAGLTLTYARAYRVGDRIKIGEHVGDVIALGAITTRIRTIKNEEVILPNGYTHSNAIINYSRFAQESGVQAHAQILLGYNYPSEQVEAVLIRAALATPGVAANPPPYVLQLELDSSSIRYEVCAATRLANELHLIETALRRKIHEHLLQAGIEPTSSNLVELRSPTVAAARIVTSPTPPLPE